MRSLERDHTGLGRVDKYRYLHRPVEKRSNLPPRETQIQILNRDIVSQALGFDCADESSAFDIKQVVNNAIRSSISLRKEAVVEYLSKFNQFFIVV
jgi:hypothetical protein